MAKNLTNVELLNHFFTLSTEDKKDTLSRELRLAKGRLNAQYGINVQQLAPNELLFYPLKNELHSTQEEKERYTKLCTSLIKFYNKKFNDNSTVYEFLRSVFCGGYVRSNRFYAFIPFDNVASYDFASSYPAQMLMCNFPF